MKYISLIVSMVVITISMTITVLTLSNPAKSATNDLKTGHIYNFHGYCLSADDAKELSATMALSGVGATTAYLKKLDNTCVHSAFNTHMPKETPLRVMGKAWTVITAENIKINFWKVQDIKGDIGYSWTADDKGEIDKLELELSKKKNERGA